MAFSLGVPSRLVQGGKDWIVPATQGTRFAAEARRRGDDSQVKTIAAAGHFDLIDPATAAWTHVVGEIRAQLGHVQPVESGEVETF